MFEPIHGSAFDIMGQGLANPIGTFWSVVMLLEHLGEVEAAQEVMARHRAGHRHPRAAHPRPRRPAPPPHEVTQAMCEFA